MLRFGLLLHPLYIPSLSLGQFTLVTAGSVSWQPVDVTHFTIPGNMLCNMKEHLKEKSIFRYYYKKRI